jgi:hypothetical protein
MDKLKLYAAPIVALAMILLWFLVVKPMLDASEQPAEPGPAAGSK